MSRRVDRIQRLSTQKGPEMWRQGGDILAGRVTRHRFEFGSETATLFHAPHKVRLEVRLINGIPLTLPNPLAPALVAVAAKTHISWPGRIAPYNAY